MIDTMIVDDDAALRVSMSLALIDTGYRVRFVDSAFAALSEIRQEIPDILLSDLNMPGMSGFELLSIVRLSFPSILLIAMSGAYSGRSVPPGVVADAFYEKGCTVGSFMQIVADIASRDRHLSTPTS